MEDIQKINGVIVSPPVPPIVDQYKNGSLIILGCGRTVWDDFNRARKIFTDCNKVYQVMVINLAFMGLEDMFRRDQVTIDHFVSLHPEYFALRTIYVKDRCRTHGRRMYPNTDYVWYFADGGTSGLFALRIAVALGYYKIIICGIPLDDQGRFFDPPGQPGDSACNSIKLEFDNFKYSLVPNYNDRIRAMSGYTKKIFGEASDKWIEKK